MRLRDRFQATGMVQERRRSGRPKKTTPREDRFIQRQALQQRNATANVIRHHLRVATNTIISDQTTRNRLHAVNLRSRRAARRPKLTPAHRAARRAWCTGHVRWNHAQWNTVLFSDESRFCLEPDNRRIRVWRRLGERFVDDCVVERSHFGGGSVMVWGGISTHHKTPLYHVIGNLTGVRYRVEILRPLVIPALRQMGPGAIFQDDNATPHRARVCTDFLQQAGVNRMLWPSNSPDLNPIEHLWDQLERRVRANHPPPANLHELLGWLQQEWAAVPQAFLANLVRSMRQRCVDCQASNGGHTRF